MNAKSALDKYLSSQTFYATSNELNNRGLQLVGLSVSPVKAINRLI